MVGEKGLVREKGMEGEKGLGEWCTVWRKRERILFAHISRTLPLTYS
jgi:hypothetical protein